MVGNMQAWGLDGWYQGNLNGKKHGIGWLTGVGILVPIRTLTSRIGSTGGQCGIDMVSRNFETQQQEEEGEEEEKEAIEKYLEEIEILSKRKTMLGSCYEDFL